MKLTRLGFNVLVLCWIAPIIFYDVIGNTLSIGMMSDLFYYKAMFDGLLAAYAAYLASQGGSTMSREQAAKRVADAADAVVDFKNLSSAEYLYAAALCVYALFNWWSLHGINKASTGIESLVSLIWSFVSIIVSLLAAVQFYHLKSGAIVQVTNKLVA